MSRSPEFPNADGPGSRETAPLLSNRDHGRFTVQAGAVRVITCIVSLAEGYDSAVFGAVAADLTKQFDLSPWSLGLLGAMAPMAFIVGGPTAGGLMNHLGRKPMLVVVCLLIAGGTLMQALAEHVFVFGAGRAIMGFGTGAGVATVTVYVTEASPAHIRGMLTSLEEIFWNLGTTTAFGVTWFVLVELGVSWRAAVMVGVILPLIAASIIPWPFTPESPRYYLLCGDEEKARITLHKLGVSNEEAQQTLNSWRAGDAAGDENGLVDELRKHRRPLSLALGVGIANMSVGITALHGFLPWILSQVMHPKTALQWATVIGTIKFVVLIPVCFMLLDTMGRKPLLCCSALIYGACSMFTAVAFALDLGGVIVAIGLGATLSSFSVGIGPATWPYLAEVLPTTIRGHGTGLSLMLSRTLAAMWMMVFPMLFAWQPSGPFVVCASAAFLSFLFYVKMCPETKLMTLEGIQNSFEYTPRVHKSAHMA